MAPQNPPGERNKETEQSCLGAYITAQVVTGCLFLHQRFKAYLPHRNRQRFYRPSRHISCRRWWQAGGCNIHWSCIALCQSQWRWRTSGHPTFSGQCCLFSPIQPPDICCQLLVLPRFDPTRDTSPSWFASPVCQAEIKKKEGRTSVINSFFLWIFSSCLYVFVIYIL